MEVWVATATLAKGLQLLQIFERRQDAEAYIRQANKYDVSESKVVKRKLIDHEGWVRNG